MGGYNGQIYRDTEIISLDGSSTTSCNTIPDLPDSYTNSFFGQSTAVALPDGRLVLCSGSDCFSLSKGDNQWTEHIDILTESSGQPSSAYVPYINGIWFIAITNSRVIDVNNMTSRAFPGNIDTANFLPCAAQINDTFTIFVDGNRHIGYNWETNTQVDLKRRNRETTSVACAVTFKSLIVAGGAQNGQVQDFTYALDLTGQDITRTQWVKKHDLPGPRYRGRAVSFQNRVFYIGGHGQSAIHKYTSNGWTTDPSVTLSKPRRFFAVVVVPDTFLDC